MPRTAPTRGALAATRMRAELEGEPHPFREVHRVVEHHQAAVSEQSARRSHRLVIEQRVEQGYRQVGAERLADLHRPNRTAARGAVAETLDDPARGDAERHLNQAAGEQALQTT